MAPSARERRPTLHLRVRSQAGRPAYVRGIGSRGEATVEIPGLGPGRFELEQGPIVNQEKRVIDEIEVDGTDDVEVMLDLR